MLASQALKCKIISPRRNRKWQKDVTYVGKDQCLAILSATLIMLVKGFFTRMCIKCVFWTIMVSLPRKKFAQNVSNQGKFARLKPVYGV
jgi:hypothetical protein